MGGAAFATGSKILHTPRMPARVYWAVKAQCHARLRQLYVHVATPIEGPEKPDFGDVDILVAVPRADPAKATASGSPPQPGTRGQSAQRRDPNAPASRNDMLARIKDALGAQAIRSSSGVGLNANFAVPWPEADEHPGVEHQAKRFIQVDVRVCKTVEELEWILFKHGHGDLWNLLGVVIRPLGLTCDDNALCIRIPEIENSNRKLARVPFLRDPDEVLYFLGLTKVTEPFGTLQDLYDYVSKSRLFWVSKTHPVSVWDDNGEAADKEPAQTSEAGPDGPPTDPVRDPDPDTPAKDIDADAGAVADADAAAVPDKPAPRVNDRRKLKQRPAVRRWIEEYLPACRAKKLHRKRAISRSEIQEQVFRLWPESEKAYQDTLGGFRACDEWVLVRKQILERLIPMPELVLECGKTSAEGHKARQVASLTRKAFLSMFCPEGPPLVTGQSIQQASRKNETKTPEDYGIPPPPGDMLDEQGRIRVDVASEWVESNKEQVGKVVWAKIVDNLGDWQPSKKDVPLDTNHVGGRQVENSDTSPNRLWLNHCVGAVVCNPQAI